MDPRPTRRPTWRALRVGAVAVGVCAAVAVIWHRLHPTVVDALPEDRPLLVQLELNGDQAPFNVVDPEHGTLVQWRGIQALERQGHGYPRGLWWSPRSQRFSVLVDRLDATDLVLFTLDVHGAFTERRVAEAGELQTHHLGPLASVLPDAGVVVFHGVDDLGGGLQRVRLRLVRTDGTGHQDIAWAQPVDHAGAVAVAQDGATVYVSGRCADGTDPDRCLYRSPLAGTPRTRVGRFPGEVCSVVPSPRGDRLAVAVRQGLYTTACDHLMLVPSVGGGGPVQTVGFMADEPRSYRGVGSLAWSPDARTLVVASDHALGCAGSEGVSACSSYLYRVEAATGARRQLTTRPQQEGALAWLP